MGQSPCVAFVPTLHVQLISPETLAVFRTRPLALLRPDL